MVAASMDLSDGKCVQCCPDRQTYLSHTQAPHRLRGTAASTELSLTVLWTSGLGSLQVPGLTS